MLWVHGGVPSTREDTQLQQERHKINETPHREDKGLRISKNQSRLKSHFTQSLHEHAHVSYL